MYCILEEQVVSINSVWQPDRATGYTAEGSTSFVGVSGGILLDKINIRIDRLRKEDWPLQGKWTLI